MILIASSCIPGTTRWYRAIVRQASCGQLVTDDLP
jgi:hypothetical protein